ncbi:MULTISPECIES: DUF5105 domain-containing protein [Vagococcus]|uniref:Lipoprotein, putative n=1 Tax=Vagococcus fluvialis bH819 TaxID=1255619 RepID=A0A1X6WN99_9ENTE|nr:MULTISPECIES: DUF5105 domain-containing protein [Vagococcus]SLM85166.1 lipoprotein, putative [Vagococcus fluvialis bH819]HCM88420.1 DUF5105 domain-containing protein [Vagococcus sp.]
MKKKSMLLIPFLMVLFLVTGCGKKGLDGDEISKVFIENFIYEKEADKFKENFVDGDILSKQLSIMTDGFQESFSEVFDPVAGPLSAKEKEEISSGLMKEVREKSDYNYTIKEESKNNIMVTYKIKGFNYSSLVETTLKGVSTEIKINNSTDPKQTKRMILSAFSDALDKGKVMEKETKVTMKFKKEKKKWVLAENQDETLEVLLLSFITGYNDKKEYSKEMTHTVQRSVTQAKSSL